MLRKYIVLVSLLVFSGCGIVAEDPKVQGARQLKKMEKATTINVLKEGQKLLKEDKDFKRYANLRGKVTVLIKMS